MKLKEKQHNEKKLKLKEKQHNSLLAAVKISKNIFWLLAGVTQKYTKINYKKIK